MRTLFAVSVLIILFSCNRKKMLPEDILEPQKMQAVFWDYIRADVYAKDFIKKDSSGSDTTQNIKLQSKVFSFYNITRKDFYKSYDYYTIHPDLMNVLMDSMLAKQNRLKLKTQFKIKGTTSLRPGEEHTLRPDTNSRPRPNERSKMFLPPDKNVKKPVDKTKKNLLNRNIVIPDQKSVREDQ